MLVVRLYRAVFGLAAAYNVGLGLWAIVQPHAFFDLFQLAPPRYPSIWSTLGMVLGLYGVGYAYAAVHLDRARPFVAIGLAGKILGPIGWILAVQAGELPVRTVGLILFDDIAWWVPFSFFLLEGTDLARRLRGAAPYACAAFNALAVLITATVLRPGTALAEDPAGYIARAATFWRVGWVVWVWASLSLLAFYAWWGARLGRPRLVFTALAIATVGLTFDLAADSLLIGWLPRDYQAVMPVATVLTGGLANGLYTLAGVILTLGTPGLRGPLVLWTWAVWGAGFLLSTFALVTYAPGVAWSTALLFILFCPWTVAIGWRLRSGLAF